MKKSWRVRGINPPNAKSNIARSFFCKRPEYYKYFVSGRIIEIKTSLNSYHISVHLLFSSTIFKKLL